MCLTQLEEYQTQLVVLRDNLSADTPNCQEIVNICNGFINLCKNTKKHSVHLIDSIDSFMLSQLKKQGLIK